MRLAVAAIVLVLAVPATATARSGRVLATGDSMIQIFDGFLKKQLRPKHFRVRSDAHISSGISKPSQLDWVKHARSTAHRYRATATVVFIGANDGFPLRWHGKRRDCCSRPWRLAYARRVRAMMRSYKRGMAAPVYWLTLPAARPHAFNRVFRAVNAALRLAARSEGDPVRLIDMAAVFTPSGHFQQTIRRAGH